MDDAAVSIDQEGGEGVLEDVLVGLGQNAELQEQVANGRFGSREEREIGAVDADSDFGVAVEELALIVVES